MKNNNKSLLILIGIISLLAILFISISSMKKPSLKDYGILHDEKFGGVFVNISINDFNKKGFKFGDSVNVQFSNGYELLDIPYYNGYYVDYEEPQVVGYPGYEYVKICLNYGDDLWEKFNLNTTNKVTIRLKKSKKYLKIQEARDIHYSDEQGKQSDIEFANFRNVQVTNIKPNILYRSASPNDNSHNRAPIVDRLIKEANIKYIVNLSDSKDDIEKHIKKDNFNSPYFLSLYKNNKVIPLSMNMQFKNKSFSDNLVKGLTAIANNDGPYLVHCVEGKDRTGFVIMVLEALVGAKYDEMINDYMETYKNYYSITKESDKDKYNTIKETNIDTMLRFITKSNEKDNLNKIDYQTKTKEYLLSIGMKEEDINKLKEKIYEKK